MRRKKCKGCGRVLPLGEFYSHARNRLFGKCKECMRRRALARYRRRRARAIEQLGGQCVDCGERDPDTLQFDHEDRATKSFDITAALAASMAQERLEREMAKCALRCLPCHQIKTARELGRSLRAPHLVEHAERFA
jgi:hypothetical protein